MAYVTADQFLASYDWRKVASELSDTNTPLSQGEVPSSDTLQQLLDEASDIVLAACLVGKRYSVRDLDHLALGQDANGASVNSGAFLRRITSDLAFGLLMARRGRAASDIAKLAPMFAQAHNYLNDLRSGVLLFAKLDDTRAEAGVPKAADLSRNPYTPTTWVAQTGGRLFPFGTSPSYSGNC